MRMNLTCVNQISAIIKRGFNIDVPLPLPLRSSSWAVLITYLRQESHPSCIKCCVADPQYVVIGLQVQYPENVSLGCVDLV